MRRSGGPQRGGRRHDDLLRVRSGNSLGPVAPDASRVTAGTRAILHASHPMDGLRCSSVEREWKGGSAPAQRVIRGPASGSRTWRCGLPLTTSLIASTADDVLQILNQFWPGVTPDTDL